MANLARLQHGVVSRAQLTVLGLGRGWVDGRRSRGLLHDAHRGVYAVGHARLTFRGKLWAAALATNSPLTHRAAGAVRELVPPRLPIEVTTTRRAATVEGIQVHRSRTLTPADITTVDGLPATTVARTILDLAQVLPPQRLTTVLKRAEHHRLLNLADVTSTPPGRRSKALRQALTEITATGPELNEIRSGGPVPRDRHQRRAPAAAGQPPRPRLHRRLRLARPQPRRRDRRSHHPPHPHGLRARPPPGRRAAARRPPRRPLHLPPGDGPAGPRHRDPRGPADARLRLSPVGFPSGQRGRAVNPLAQPSQVRILPPPLSESASARRQWAWHAPARRE